MHKLLMWLFDKFKIRNANRNLHMEELELKYAKKIEKKRKKQARTFKFWTLKIIYPYLYKKYSKAPIDENKVIFLEIRLTNLTSNFTQLYDLLANQYDFSIHCHFLRNSFVSRPNYVRRCANFVQDLATAKYVFMNEASNVIGGLDIREGTVITQLWHGCGAFKKFGKSTADLIFGDSRKDMERFPFHRNYSFVTLSSPEVEWAYEEAFDFHKDVYRPVGTSRTDVFYDEKFIQRAKERFDHIFPGAKGKKVILYAPTFRGRVATATTPDMLNIRMFAEQLSDEYVLVFKHHPVVKFRPEIPDEYRDTFAKDLSDTMSIDDLLCVSDICISDYSSLVFEYSLFERPMIFFAYDKKDYDDWRGFYYDYSEFCPGPILTTNRDMINYIINIKTEFDKDKVHAFRQKFMSACDGHVTQRVLDMVFGEDVLAKHKKECKKFLELSSVPNSGKNGFNIRARNALYGKMKAEGQSRYDERAAASPIDEKLVAVYNQYGANELADVFKKYGYNAVPLSNKENFIKHIDTLAKAKYIVSNYDYELLDILKFRQGTKLIYSSRDPFMFEKFALESMDYVSGNWRERYKVAPAMKNRDMIISSSMETAPRDADCCKVDPSKILLTGNITADLYYNEDYKNRVFTKLEKYRDPYNRSVLPKDYKNRKIIAYLPCNRHDGAFDGANMPSDSYLYEYFHNDYIILKHYGAGKPNEEMLEYYSDTISDVTLACNSNDLIAIADIVIGDYRNSVFSAAAARKPIFIYAPEYQVYIPGFNTELNYTDVLPGPLYQTSKSLCDAVDDVEHYDYSILDAFREKYLTFCDGHSVERLTKELPNII